MKDIFLLTKVLIKNSYSISKVKKKDIVGYTIVYSILLSYACFFTYTATKALSTIGKENIALNVIFMSVLCLILFQNIITSINMLFFSKDAEHILPLPVTSKKLFIAKINCLLFTEYVSNLVYFLPALITYGVVLKLGSLYYIYSVLLFFVFPILPLALVIFVMSIMMRFTRIIRNKDAAQYISVVMSLLLISLVIFLSSNTSNDITVEELNSILLNANNISNKISDFFIIIKHAVNTLDNYETIEGLKNLFYLIIETAIAYLVLIFTVEKFFIRIILNINSSSSKTKKIRNKDSIYNKKSIILSFLKKEFIILSRNSIYCMQCLVPSVLMPVFIILPIAIAINNGDEEAISLIQVFESNQSIFWLSLRLIILQFLFGISFISITSISREGKDAFVMKYIPLSYEKQISYKSYVGVIMNFAPILILIALEIYIKSTIQIEQILIFSIIGLLSSLFFNYALVLVDLKHPKLKWDSEYAVVKQNINMAFGLFIATFTCAVILIATVLTNSYYMFITILCILFIVLIILVKLYIRKKAKILFEKLEV